MRVYHIAMSDAIGDCNLKYIDSLFVVLMNVQFGTKPRKYKLKVVGGAVMVRIGCSYEPLAVFIDKIDPCRSKYTCANNDNNQEYVRHPL